MQRVGHSSCLREGCPKGPNPSQAVLECGLLLLQVLLALWRMDEMHRDWAVWLVSTVMKKTNTRSVTFKDTLKTV